MSGFGKEQEQQAIKQLTISQLAGKELSKQAESHYEQGDIKQAENLYKQAVNAGFASQLITSRLGEICSRSGRAEEAISWILQTLEINPKHSDNYKSYARLGIIYKDLGDLDKALSSTLKSLELKPDNPTVLINLGGIYKDLGNLDQALASTIKSLELKPDNPKALINLGGIYKHLGKLDHALASTLKSLEIKPDNPTAHMNLGLIYEVLNELDHALESYTQSANLITKHKEESCLTSLISASTILLQMNEIEHAKTTLINAIKIVKDKDTPFKPCSTENKNNNNAYLYYLSKLIPEIPSLKSGAGAQILHLGESHCLTFTNQRIQSKGKVLTIKPSLVKGAKAFHLSESSKLNPQKISLETRMHQNLNKYEYIFLSFGEIDCRADEGILKHCQKTRNTIEDVSKTTAKNYFKWTTSSLSKYKEKLVYFGTPAPLKTDPNSEIPSEEDRERLITIRIFNTTLIEQCQESGILFADVYTLTAGEDGYNNNKWMIDSKHLKPDALKELIKSLHT